MKHGIFPLKFIVVVLAATALLISPMGAWAAERGPVYPVSYFSTWGGRTYAGIYAADMSYAYMKMQTATFPLEMQMEFLIENHRVRYLSFLYFGSLGSHPVTQRFIYSGGHIQEDSLSLEQKWILLLSLNQFWPAGVPELMEDDPLLILEVLLAELWRL